MQGIADPDHLGTGWNGCSSTQTGHEPKWILDQVQRGENVRREDIGRHQCLNGQSFDRLNADADRSLAQHLGVVRPLTQRGDARRPEVMQVIGFGRGFVPRRDTDSLQPKLTIDGLLPTVGIGREEMNRQAIFQRRESLGDTGDQLTVDSQCAVDV